MSIDLQKHREAIVAAWKTVVDRKSATNWALFGYEGQSNVLKVQDTGEDGICELAGELNSGKIQYAFLRVDNSETGIAKFVFINWQGEGGTDRTEGNVCEACARCDGSGARCSHNAARDQRGRCRGGPYPREAAEGRGERVLK
uniref:Putative cell migration n=1 Tax=Anopheles aquasalis TaxID=42839 RepID=T1E813_ANOAQ